MTVTVLQVNRHLQLLRQKSGGKAVLETFCIAEDESEEFADNAAVIVDDREIGTTASSTMRNGL